MTGGEGKVERSYTRERNKHNQHGPKSDGVDLPVYEVDDVDWHGNMYWNTTHYEGL
jgi:hypothetical protein